jgi:hypothetical protein
MSDINESDVSSVSSSPINYQTYKNPTYVFDTIDEINTFISTITNRYKNIGDHPMITVISCEKYDELYIFMLMHDINVETLDFKYDKIIINTNITENCYNESKYMNDLYDIMIEVWKKFVLYR